MSNSVWENKIIDLLNGELSEVEAHEVRQAIAEDSAAFECYKHFVNVNAQLDRMEQVQPPLGLKDDFYQFLNTYDTGTTGSHKGERRLPVGLMRRAAIGVLLIAVGLLFGINIVQKGKISGLNSEIGHMESKMFALLENESVGDRIKAVSMGSDLPIRDNRVQDALVRAMINDESGHVRLAAVDALSTFIENEAVRTAMVRALGSEKDPAVQIALINALSQTRDEKFIDDLDRLIESDETLDFVRQEAHLGKIKLINT